MKNLQTKKTLQQMKKMIAYLRVELEVLSEKVDESLERQKRLRKEIRSNGKTGGHG